MSEVRDQKARLEMAVEHAQQAFWRTIGEAYEEVKTGDFGPEETFAFDRACETAVSTWLRYNLPGGEVAVGDRVWCVDLGMEATLVDKMGYHHMVRTDAHEWCQSEDVAAVGSPRAEHPFLYE